jgi:bacteriorhodopsin
VFGIVSDFTVLFKFKTKHWLIMTTIIFVSFQPNNNVTLCLTPDGNYGVIDISSTHLYGVIDISSTHLYGVIDISSTHLYGVIDISSTHYFCFFSAK